MPREHVEFRRVSLSDRFRIIAGKPVELKTVCIRGNDVVLVPYAINYLRKEGVVGTHGAIDYQVKPMSEVNWVEAQNISDPLMRARVLKAIKDNEKVGHITAREVPPLYRTKLGAKRTEKLNIGKRLLGRAINHLKQQGVKLVFAATEHPNALKSQTDMGMQSLYLTFNGHYILAMKLDERPRKAKRGKI